MEKRGSSRENNPRLRNETDEMKSEAAAQKSGWVGWLPIAVLPVVALSFRDRVPPWVLMWALAFAIFGGLKWLTWWRARMRLYSPAWRSVAFLLAWPGMDADAFLDANRRVSPPLPASWLWAALETALGAIVFWFVARTIPTGEPLLRGWAGMLGLILLLHFGSFQLIAFFWQTLGVDAKPIMSAPALSTSLAEFWGKRWNLGFHQLAYDLIFRPLHRTLGTQPASLLVFLASGLIHDLVISVPARAGYGLPSAYFLLQGIGIQIERTKVGKRLGLREGLRGWLFTAVFVSAPAFWLFHPWFVMRVILPFMHAMHAL
jgi:Membrane bound O-acyl transferase family